MRRSKLSIKQILQWADTYYEDYGCWPMARSKHTISRLRQGLNEKWRNIDQCLRNGLRGLRPGGSLARLLAQHRGKRNRKALPKYTVRQILKWADAHHRAHGKWPTVRSGPIDGTNGETWCAVGAAMELGNRGMPWGESLPLLLAAKRGVKNVHDLPRLSVRQILAWADAYHQRTGHWPIAKGESVSPEVDTSWQAVDLALRRGSRRLPGGQSLSRLLAAKRGVSPNARKSPFDLEEVLRWSDAHRARTGTWPLSRSGPIPEAPGENWSRVDKALRDGDRGMPAGLSLSQLLVERRGKRNSRDLPKYTIRLILQWADAHYARYEQWPQQESEPILDAPGETWSAVVNALSKGNRGLPGGTSLLKLLCAERGVKPRFTVREILACADAYHERTGGWPVCKSGAVMANSKITWQQLDSALRRGGRGLRGGTSLSQLLASRGRSARPSRKQ